MRTAVLLLATLLLWPACGEEATPSPPVLPAAFLGTWEHTGTGGGIDGRTVPMREGPPDRIVLTAENTIVKHGGDGSSAVKAFEPRKGKTIFSQDDEWMIDPAGGGPTLVLRILPDGSLVISDNVYDGFSSSYRRVAEDP